MPPSACTGPGTRCAVRWKRRAVLVRSMGASIAGVTRKGSGEGAMEYLIGVGLAVLVCVFAMVVGFDRDRAFYPTVVAVNATYYILFAVMGSSTAVLAIECVFASAFFVIA